MTDPRRTLPSVGALLESDGVRALIGVTPRSVVADAVRVVIDGAREQPAAAPTDPGAWADAVADAVRAIERPSLRPVLNATGVVLHTNLGRAPLPAAALAAIQRVASGFSNLEYDLDAGQRGSRYTHAVTLLRELTGAEDALVVNNGAAALVLALDTFSHGKDAIVSRGELVEIGGSFRVPDIMKKSGAWLTEVGTTNRTHLADYVAVMGASTGVLVKIHRSNFAIEGFTAEVSGAELARLGADRHVPVLHDLGSGLMMALDAWGLSGEPTARDAVRDGATVVMMSGDKLLGGPQCGILLGTADAIQKMRANPLVRALRVDKLTLAALEATLALYRDGERARSEIPALAMLTAPQGAVRARAAECARQLASAGLRCRVVDSEASVGGGAFPTARIPSAAVVLDGDARAAERALRLGDPPAIGRIADGALHLDLRSVLPSEDRALVAAVVAAVAGVVARRVPQP
ncbi:MAG: L-seryl-tRNA(Sec) selenium transferase [Gemmatimonadaceae bacterium]